jgi:hypothetical protein
MNTTLGRVVVVLLGVMAIAVLTPPVVEAQISLDVLACKKFDPGTQGGFFSLRYSQCGTQFTAKDPYVGLVAHLRNITEHTRVTVELLDPAQTAVWKRETRYETDSGTYYPNIWVWVILPVAADVSTIATENVRLTTSIVRLTERPAAERLGEWTLRAQADRLGSRTLKVMLLPGP